MLRCEYPGLSCAMWLRAAFAAIALVFLPVATGQAADGDEQCTFCHWKESEAIEPTKHSVVGDPRSPAGKGSACQSCHGPSEEHAQNFRVKPAVVFSTATQPEQRDATCLACHEGGNRAYWAGAAHARSDVACNDCHKAHRPTDPVIVASAQSGVCFDCHKDVRAATLSLSTHPLRSGWMPCSSCHNSHGSVGDASLIKANVNDTCFTCHADKRGPYLWTHPPAAENCASCHDAHGTNNAPLLVTRQPYLCMQCHLTPQHGSNLFSGNNLPPATGGAQMLGNSCANCHMKVHGSNHPSGSRLTR